MKIAILFGGKSGEHEVSLVSASSVMEYLPEEYEIVPIGITKRGEWFSGDGVMEYLKTGKKNGELHAFSPSDLVKVADFVFPVLHGPNGEDGTIQGLLETLNIPYAGCGVLASAAGMDKIVMRQLFAAADLPQTEWMWFSNHDWKTERKEILPHIAQEFGFPIFTKPANMGSSVGVMKSKNIAELEKNIDFAFQFDRRVIVEKAVNKPREIELSVLGNHELDVSVPGEIIPDAEFYSFESKYISGGSKSVIPAPNLSDETVQKLQEYAADAFIAIDGAGLARADFLISEDGEIFINELNTLPGFTSISMYPKLWAASGLPYSDLLEAVIELGMERWEEKQSLQQDFSSGSDWFQK